MNEHPAQIRILPLLMPNSFALPPVDGTSPLTRRQTPVPFQRRLRSQWQRRPPSPPGDPLQESVQPNTSRVVARNVLQVRVQALDPQLQVFPLLPEKVQQATHANAQFLVGILQDLRQLLTQAGWTFTKGVRISPKQRDSYRVKCWKRVPRQE